MTTLGRTPEFRTVGESPVGSPGRAHWLLARLHEESDRQVPFSQAKLLLREAAFAIERLEADVARLTATLEAERAVRQQAP